MTQPPGNYGPPQGGGYGPPQQGYGPPQGQWGPPPPPKKKHTGRNIVLGIVGVIILIVIITAVAGGGGSKNSTTSSAPSAKSSTGSKQQTGPLDHSADVKITSCTTDSTLQAPVAKLTVTNSSSKPSDYSITVAFESKDGTTQYDTGNAFVQNLGPGQSSQQEAPSLKQDIPAGFTCKVVSADRLSAVG